jgi:hypothetical protein
VLADEGHDAPGDTRQHQRRAADPDDHGDRAGGVERVQVLGAEDERPVVLAADQLEPLVRRVRDVHGGVSRRGSRPRQAHGPADDVASQPGEVAGEPERHGDLHDRTHRGGPDVGKRVREQVSELVEPEVDQPEQRHPNVAEDREPRQDEAAAQGRDVSPSLRSFRRHGRGIGTTVGTDERRGFVRARRSRPGQ